MFMRLFAMLLSCSCVMLCVFVLAAPVMMLGLMMMMRSSVMMSGSRVMVFLSGMLRSLCHLGVPPRLI